MTNWKDNLRPGSFRGAPFVIESSDGEIGRRFELHQYPLRDEPYAEDLGRKARRFTLDLFVLGAEYMAGRDALIAAFEQAGPGLLVHPYLGEMTVAALDVRGPAESTREGGMARFTATFVEAGAALFPKPTADTVGDVGDAADMAAAAVQAEFAQNFSASKPEFLFSAAKTLVQTATDKLSALRQSFPGVPAAVTEFVSDLQDFSAAAEALIRAPADLAVAVYGLIADVALLPDRPLRAISAYRQLWHLYTAAPQVSPTTSTRRRQADNQQALADLVHRAATVEAVRTAATLAYASYDEALALRDELAARLDLQMETAGDASYMALADLRVALVIDIAIRGANLARIAYYTPADTLPALVLAYQIYGDAARDSDIIARNAIRHPGFVTGGDKLEVLADA
jgi:prophage DNA circulation protein